MIDAFQQGLSDTGYIVGQNVAFEHRAAGSDYDRFNAMANDLVRRQVAVIFATGGTIAAFAAKNATSTIPIVFYVGGDPVKQGLVASLNRPGGNLTGLGWLGVALGAKRLEIVRELVPTGIGIAMLANPNNPDSEFEIRDVQEAARILGRQIHVVSAGSDADFDGVFAMLVKQQTSHPRLTIAQPRRMRWNLNKLTISNRAALLPTARMKNARRSTTTGICADARMG